MRGGTSSIGDGSLRDTRVTSHAFSGGFPTLRRRCSGRAREALNAIVEVNGTLLCWQGLFVLLPMRWGSMAPAPKRAHVHGIPNRTLSCPKSLNRDSSLSNRVCVKIRPAEDRAPQTALEPDSAHLSIYRRYAEFHGLRGTLHAVSDRRKDFMSFLSRYPSASSFGLTCGSPD